MNVDPIDPRTRWLSGCFDDCASTAAAINNSDLAVLATSGLAACCSVISNPPREVTEVIRIGEGAWRDAHAAFDAVRVLTLRAEQQPCANNDVAYLLLYVAENAARVIYNASIPDDPFDADSGAWLLTTMAEMVRSHKPAQREELAKKLAALVPHQVT